MAATVDERRQDLLRMPSDEIVVIYQRLTHTEGVEPAFVFSPKIDLISRILKIEFPCEPPADAGGDPKSK